jgi:hypothetical protein
VNPGEDSWASLLAAGAIEHYSVVGEAIVLLIGAVVMTVGGWFFWAWWNDEDPY